MSDGADRRYGHGRGRWCGKRPVRGPPASAGVSLTVTVADTRKTITLTNNGTVSNGTVVGPLGAEPPAAGRRVAQHGRSEAHARRDQPCQAGRLNLAGAAWNREIVIRLTSTNPRLQSVKAFPEIEHTASSLTKGHFRGGGSQYVATLNAARSDPPGSEWAALAGYRRTSFLYVIRLGRSASAPSCSRRKLS